MKLQELENDKVNWADVHIRSADVILVTLDTTNAQSHASSFSLMQKAREIKGNIYIIKYTKF